MSEYYKLAYIRILNKAVEKYKVACRVRNHFRAKGAYVAGQRFDTPVIY